MKSFLLLLLIFLGFASASGQDSIRAVNTFRHRITGGNITPEKTVIEQKTYDLLDRIVLDITYFDSVPNINTYTRYYYDKDLLLSKESFTGDKKVLLVKRYAYSDNGLITDERIFEPVKNKMKNTKTLKFSYAQNKLTSKLILNENGKWLQKFEYSYKDYKEFINLTFNKKYEASVSDEYITNEYDGKNLKIHSGTRTFRDGHTLSEETRYIYDPATNKLSEEIWLENGEIFKRIEYSWFMNGTLNKKAIYDGKDQLTEYLSYKYIQRIVILGDQPMIDLSQPLSE